MLKFKIGDQVKVTLGKDKGREGKIEKIFPKDGKVLIPGINVYKKSIKAQFAKDKKGGIYDISRPVSFAAIMLVCPKCKKPTRVAFRGKGRERKRICKKCKSLIDIKLK